MSLDGFIAGLGDDMAMAALQVVSGEIVMR
jgi:hypothetical protein